MTAAALIAGALLENIVFQGKSSALSWSAGNRSVCLQTISATPARSGHQHGLLVYLYMTKAPEDFSLRYRIFDEDRPASLVGHFEYRFVIHVILHKAIAPFSGSLN